MAMMHQSGPAMAYRPRNPSNHASKGTEANSPMATASTTSMLSGGETIVTTTQSTTMHE